jgi:hypothetical protein
VQLLQLRSLGDFVGATSKTNNLGKKIHTAFQRSCTPASARMGHAEHMIGDDTANPTYGHYACHEKTGRISQPGAIGNPRESGSEDHFNDKRK